MLPAGQLPELFESRHRALLDAPRADAFLQRRVVQLALRPQQPRQRRGLIAGRLQDRLKRTEHTPTMNKGCDTTSQLADLRRPDPGRPRTHAITDQTTAQQRTNNPKARPDTLLP
jgi:hypothetical protein